MPTNPLGPGKTTLTLYMDAALFIEVAKLAGVSGVKPAEYARTVLQSAVENELLVRKNSDDERAYFASIGKPGQKPPIRLEVVCMKPPNIIQLPTHAEPFEQLLRVAEKPQTQEQGSQSQSQTRYSKKKP